VSEQKGGGGVQGSYWQQLAGDVHSAGFVEQPLCDPVGHLPSLDAKHAGAVPPQQGITQY
jgi:hypothetical protein